MENMTEDKLKRRYLKTYFRLAAIFTTLILVCGLVFQSLNSTAQTEEEQVKSTYTAKKAKINDSLAQTKNVLDQLKNSYTEAAQQKRTYQEEKKANEEDIDKNNQTLTDYKYAVAQLDEQIASKEKDIATRKDKVGIILKQLWQEKDSSTIEILLNSENFSEIITGLNQLNTLEDSLLENVKSLNAAKALLEDDRTQKLTVQKDLEDAQIILNANKQKLEALVAEYANNEAKYQDDIAKKEQEAKQGQDQLAQLQKEQENKLADIRKKREAEIARKAEEARLAALAANGGKPTAALSGTNPNASSLLKNNTGSTQYGSCNSMTMPGVFPVKFGELGAPSDGVLTQRYGSTTLSYSIYNCHNGFDLANSCGTPLVSTYDGIVYAADYAAGGYGNFVVIEHSFSGGKLYALYAHMKSKTPLPIGTRVSKGDIVGYMGSTGFSTGCHLHFTLIDGESLIYDRNRDGSSPVGLYYNPLEYLSL